MLFWRCLHNDLIIGFILNKILKNNFQLVGVRFFAMKKSLAFDEKVFLPLGIFDIYFKLQTPNFCKLAHKLPSTSHQFRLC